MLYGIIEFDDVSIADSTKKVALPALSVSL
jgi:hypothetical protein